MAVLLLAAESDTQGHDTKKVLTAARAVGEDVDILVSGDDVNNFASLLAELSGVRKVLCAEAPYLKYHLAEPLAALLFSLSGSYDVFIASGNSTGKNVMPRLAGLLGVSQFSDIISVLSPDRFKRSTYAGNVIETVESLEMKKVITVRSSSFLPYGLGNNRQRATIEKIFVPEDPCLSRLISQVDRAGHDLSSASIVVSGGRAFGSEKAFKELLEPLAERFGAAIGASRAAVDAGYISNDCQVGQTGKVVSPELYIAIGISGSVQHLSGMLDSRVIVAINKDSEAPIFRVADYGLVGDLFQVLPELMKVL
ncbi:MAG: electron transfer flavoprotein alpha subunit [Candidatus Tokpelaia sp. JSC161]|jgi:electron transfer flavoprotein alpha subunit|nr:MAG: electron transfer flavoprotein alpha subunit [Candidatus Tokpelaia sp. JSC161]